MREFKTMLAAKAPPMEQIRWPVLASPKLDGVRGHCLGGAHGLVSRNMLPFRNADLQKRFSGDEFRGLDGELMVGDPTHPEAFRQTGKLNSYHADVSEVKLFVFDDFTDPTLPFHNRLEMARRRIRGLPQFQLVVHTMINDAEELSTYEAGCLARGYEGVMIRDPMGRYKYGRSTAREGWLLKVKQFEDSEFVIDDVEELFHNANEKTLTRNGKAVRNSKKEGKVGMDKLGALIGRDIHHGGPVRVGSGFNDSERHDLWVRHKQGLLVGLVGKYQFFPTGSKDKPRFPTWKGFRDPVDMP